MAVVDLHCHTLASDGALPPAVVVQRAYDRGVRCLAITDHDTCAGLSEAQLTAQQLDMQLITGIELSSQWQGMGIHVVGLDFDPQHPAITEAVDYLYEARVSRAQLIGERLEKLEMTGVYEAAMRLAGRPDVGRPHIAQAMQQLGYVKTVPEAFDRYLGAGKVGDVKMHWPTVERVVQWIVDSGGIAVLAHPGKYKMTWAKMRRLLETFKAAGGGAMEVSYGGENPDRLVQLVRLANQYKLKVSAGSDFHNPQQHWTELGKYPPIKGECNPVWTQWLA